MGVKNGCLKYKSILTKTIQNKTYLSNGVETTGVSFSFDELKLLPYWPDVVFVLPEYLMGGGVRVGCSEGGGYVFVGIHIFRKDVCMHYLYECFIG